MQKIAPQSVKNKTTDSPPRFLEHRSNSRRISTERTPLKTDSIPVSTLKKLSSEWILDGEVRQHSKRTLESRRQFLEKVWWFCDKENITSLDRLAVRKFLLYSASSPEGGRWGNPQANREVSCATVATWHIMLGTLLNWISRERESPLTIMKNVDPPAERPDQKVPLTDLQIGKLLSAAKASLYPERNCMIIKMLLETGLRASELISLKWEDVDMEGRRFSVLGKGGKRRTIEYGKQLASVLWKFRRSFNGDLPTYLLISERGTTTGETLTRSGLTQLISKLGVKAGITTVQCTPHILRHTMAIEWLRKGGDQFSLMHKLGHTDVAMTSRYVNVARADMTAQTEKCSFLDNYYKRKD